MENTNDNTPEQDPMQSNDNSRELNLNDGGIRAKEEFDKQCTKQCKIAIIIEGELPIILDYRLHPRETAVVRTMLAVRLASELAWSTGQTTHNMDKILESVELNTARLERKVRMGLVNPHDLVQDDLLREDEEDEEDD